MIVRNKLRKFFPHILADMEQIVMFKVSDSHNMKISYDSHDLVFTQLAGFDAFPGAITQLMCLQLFDKCLITIINVAENFNKLSTISTFKLLITNYLKIAYYIELTLIKIEK